MKMLAFVAALLTGVVALAQQPTPASATRRTASSCSTATAAGNVMATPGRAAATARASPTRR